jgi:hypothetical protein
LVVYIGSLREIDMKKAYNKCIDCLDNIYSKAISPGLKTSAGKLTTADK